MKRSSTKNGFGLLEVTFATGVFIIVAGSLVTLSRLSLRNASLATHRSQATYLAQDGLETIRQMRDTSWIQRSSQTSNPTKDWLTYPDCSGSYPANGVLLMTSSGQPNDYAICYDSANFSLPQFGLKAVSAQASYDQLPRDTNLFMSLAAADGAPDPAQPLYYKRTVRFEPVPDTAPNPGCPGGANADYLGLQLLIIDETGKICTAAGAEAAHAIKVKVSVEWIEFDRPWQVSLETLLTNWRSR